MIEFNYSISSDTLNGVLNFQALNYELSLLELPEVLLSLTVVGDNLKFTFDSSNDVTVLDIALDNLVANHMGEVLPHPRIMDFVRPTSKDKDFRDVDYKVELNAPLYPKRTFVRGELRQVKWFSDDSLVNEILRVDIVYTRDLFGFASSRITTRSWVLSDGSLSPLTKVTRKNYTINSVDQIIEGKKRRENIVNGVQLPVMQFMIESIQGVSTGQILLMGRDFMDRFSLHFKTFIDNSSSVVDFNDPNFGKKTVVVAFEEAALTTDTWLNNTCPSLGGVVTILQYLTNEFSI